MMADCACGNSWRIEACDLRTGRVRQVLHPLSFNFQTSLNAVGQGTMTLATREYLARDIWPHLTSVYITRVAGGSATPTNPVVEFAGLIEQFSASEGGATQVGLKSIEHYLFRRHLDQRDQYTNRPQTLIGRGLVNRALPNGIPLFALADDSNFPRDRVWEAWERKNIGEAISQLTEVIDGPDWELTHAREEGAWSTTIIFRDYVGVDREFTVQSDREASAYSLEVDATDHATHVDAIGAGEEAAQLIATANDLSGIYPQFDEAPAYKDVTIFSTLQSHADGYLEDHQEPVATPTVSIAGLDPDPELMALGDTCGVDVDYGAVTYRGRGRITSVSWSVTADNPETRTYEFIPLTRASESVLNQFPSDPCPDGNC